MTTRRFSLSILMGIGLFLAGCAGLGSRSAAGPDVVQAAEYNLGTGDKVRVTVFGEPSLTGEFLVSGAGAISLPLIGDVPAAGLTMAEFQRAVETALRGRFMLNPRVSAEVLTYRPYYVLGEVNSPGTFAYANGLTVLNAVATAGGFTYRADTKRVLIRRAGSVQEQALPLGSATAVLPGDTIRIAERWF